MPVKLFVVIKNTGILGCDTTVSELLAKEKFDAIVHLAGQTTVTESIKNPFLDGQINIQGIINILQAAAKAKVKRILFSSTAAAYGDNDNLPLKESEQVKPLSFYGLSKVTAEEYIKLYNSYFGLEYINFRFSNVYGERQGDGGEGGVISVFARQAAAGNDIHIFGDGSQTRDFIYAGDIAAGIEKGLRTDHVNDTYNLSTMTETSLNELADIFNNVAASRVNVIYEEKRTGDIYRSMLDNSTACRNLNWQPQVSLSDGIKRTYEYFI